MFRIDSLCTSAIFSYPVFSFEVCHFSIIPSGNTYLYILVMLFIMDLIFSPLHIQLSLLGTELPLRPVRALFIDEMCGGWGTFPNFLSL